MFTKKTIKDIDLKGKTVLLRADYNVPIDNGKITDDYRIKQSLATVNYLIEHANKLIICSHLGRPKGTKDLRYSLKPVSKHLSHLLDKEVKFADDCVGLSAQEAVKALKDKQVLVLENLRFHTEEEANDDAFAKQLASFADIFVQDGFGVVHRKHATTYAITKHLPSVSGLLLEKEVDTITKVMEKPERPLISIIAGAKIADKIELLEVFIKIADFVAIGGALADTFIAAKGIKIGKSLIDKDELGLAKDIMAKADKESKKRPFVFAVPHDVVVSEKIDRTFSTRIVDFSSNSFVDIINYPHRVPEKDIKLKANEMILDIGPFSASFIAGAIQLSKTVVWNGTMGVTETKGLQGPIGPYAHGTQTIIEAVVGDLGNKPFSLVGGGDTVGYIEQRQLTDSFNHVSTGGGASLELMSGHKLPGIEALNNKS